MRDLAPHDRPREKLLRAGSTTLGDNELVALLLGHGLHRMSALDLANELLEAAGGLHGLTRVTPDDLRRVRGVGPVSAARILAAVELGRRSLVGVPHDRPQFLTPRELAVFLLPQFGSRPIEQFGVVLLDVKYRLLRLAIVSVGGLDGSVVAPRDVFRVAAAGGAAVIALFHNHPSGDPTPSRADVEVTARLREAGRVVGIEVVDHVILGDSSYYSFKESAW
jgi:DNA repair protein RadC